MSVWVLLQIVLNIFLVLGIGILWIRLNRPPKDDPRLSRGLQLLQSKIAVLEDLSDRTDVQVNQLSALLEQKMQQVQKKVQEADRQVQTVNVSIEKSKEVAEIFHDKIPHREIIDRQNSIKYVKAARLAHQGVPAAEIVKMIDLPAAEIEFIAKINREKLMFSEDQLPVWARDKAASEIRETKDIQPDFSEAFQNSAQVSPELQKLGEEFRAACQEMKEEKPKPTIPSPTVRPVEFPKVDVKKNLS